MVNFDFGSDFVTIDNTRDGQIAVILDEGEESELEYKGKKKKVLNISVEINQKKLTWTPGLRAGRACQKVWGKDTKDWIGKKFEILHIDKKMHIRPIY